MADELLKILLYFDVFSYPLTKRELITYSGISTEDGVNADTAIEILQKKGLINQFGELYFVGTNRHNVFRRLNGNNRAAGRMRTARRFSRLISWFPFVRGVFISGSLSKGFAAKKDDIDYFIVTEPERLWLVRSLLTIFKKVFLLNSYRNFCINYFVDSNHLFIKEHNRFTATETVFLVPMYNSAMHQSLLDQNSWVKEYYPNVMGNNNHDCYNNEPVLKRLTEKLLSGPLTGKLDDYLYRRSRTWIRRQFSDMDDDAFKRNFRVLRHELQYFPNSYHFSIMDKYNERVNRFLKVPQPMRAAQ